MLGVLGFLTFEKAKDLYHYWKKNAAEVRKIKYSLYFS